MATRPLPLGCEQEREGGDEGEPAGDLASAGAGEQALALDVDARVDERGEETAAMNHHYLEAEAVLFAAGDLL